MPALSCPHCGSASIIVGGEPDTDVCPRMHCGGIMERHATDVDASTALRKALYSLDLAAEKEATDRSFRNALHKAVTVTAEEP